MCQVLAISLPTFNTFSLPTCQILQLGLWLNKFMLQHCVYPASFGLSVLWNSRSLVWLRKDHCTFFILMLHSLWLSLNVSKNKIKTKLICWTDPLTWQHLSTDYEKACGVKTNISLIGLQLSCGVSTVYHLWEEMYISCANTAVIILPCSYILGFRECGLKMSLESEDSWAVTKVIVKSWLTTLQT